METIAPGSASGPKAGRLRTLGLILVAATLGVLVSSCRPGHQRESADAVRQRQPNVVLFILDMVRRDRVTPCGEERPLTPNLERAASLGRTYCGMVTPGTWTLPTHASMLTGLLPTAHGADFIPDGVRPENMKVLSISGMRTDIPTLAAGFSAAGYQTVFVSGNPVLSPNVGITRDFDVSWTERDLKMGWDALVAPKLESVIGGDSLSRDAPLLLVVNIFIAHGPLEQVPPGNGIIEPTERVLNIMGGGQESIFGRFVRNELMEPMRTKVLEEVTRGYDWGVHLADDDFGRCMTYLGENGWVTSDTVIAVTSDHGEMLGEHGLLDHGRSVIRSNVDVFAVVVGPGFEPGSRSDTPVQSQDLFPTLLEAAGLPSPELPHARSMLQPGEERTVLTVSQPDDFWLYLSKGVVGGTRYTAVQRGGQRVVLADPDDGPSCELLDGTAIDEGTDCPLDLLSQSEALMAEAQQMAGAEITFSPEELEALRKLGYVR